MCMCTPRTSGPGTASAARAAADDVDAAVLLDQQADHGGAEVGLGAVEHVAARGPVAERLAIAAQSRAQGGLVVDVERGAEAGGEVDQVAAADAQVPAGSA